jgi:UDP-N-acetylmuramoylalanine--D-glutamate ligase
MNLEGKKVAVLGAGGSGLAAAALALSCGASVAAFDSGDPEKLAGAVESFSGIGVVLTCGESALSPSASFDLAVISPGIDASWPIGRVFEEASEELIGEIEFAFRLSKIPVIAITGTNGKTTTTSLVADMLNGAGLKAIAAGNIGIPYSDVVRSGEPYDWIVLEVSSFQLETIESFRPAIAIWMNFAPDHMDRYATLEDYRAAKLRIFENYGPECFAITKLEDGFTFDSAVTFSAFSGAGDYRYEAGRIQGPAGVAAFHFHSCHLHGLHNAENVMVALAVADRLGLDREKVTPPILAFRAPEHRCEPVGEVDGVTYINDSKSTNLHSLKSALDGQEKPVLLICGGKDKGLDFSELNDSVSASVTQVICIGEIANSILSTWGDIVPCKSATSLEDAVSLARSHAEPGDIVLFSPGTSSFDMFSGYTERGNAFRDAVQQLAS